MKLPTAQAAAKPMTTGAATTVAAPTVVAAKGWSQTLVNKGFQDLKFSKSPKLSKNPRKSRIFGEVLKRGA